MESASATPPVAPGIPRKMMIFGVPRSGTSWIGEIVNSSPHVLYCYQPLFAYALKDFLTPASSRDDIEAFFAELAVTDDPFIRQADRRRGADFPSFAKQEITHIAFKEVRYINILNNLMRRAPDVFLCAVIRNPLSVIHSWLRAPREFRRDLGWSEMEEWRYALRKNLNRPEEFHGYEKWKEAANLFLSLRERYPDRVFIARYGRFLADPHGEAQALFHAAGLPLTRQTEDFLDASTTRENDDPYSVYRSGQRDDKWREGLDRRIVTEVRRDLRDSALETYLDGMEGAS